MSAEHSTDWSKDMPGEAAEIQLPEIVSAEQFMAETHEIPAELVKGLIHRGTLTMFAGGSKAAKTFTLMDLGLSVAHGWPFWGREVVKGRVLYINFEIGRPFFQGRLRSMSEALALPDPLQNFDIWNLRGYAADAQKIVPQITDRCREKDYSMIIVDPIYKLMEGRNENAAGEMAEFLNLFEKLSNETGAAVVYSHHFAKGLASGKDQLDRASGSGVFSRHADGIITMTAHESDNAYVVEGTLRNFRAPLPFVVRWDYPLMRIDAELDPTKLKSKAGRKEVYTPAGIAAHLVDGMSAGQWKTAARVAEGCAESTFDLMKKRALEAELVRQDGKAFYRIPKVKILTFLDSGNGIKMETLVRDATPADVNMHEVCEEFDRKEAEKAAREAA